MVKRKMGKKKKKTRFRVLKIAFTTILLISIFTLVAGMGIGLAMIKTAPPLDINKIRSLNEPSVIYNDSEKFMDTVVSNEHRTIVYSNVIPNNLKNAIVSIEDERFMSHKGIDIKRLFGVVIKNLSNKLTGKSGIQGASTITQQLIKKTLLSDEVKIKRKVQEMYLALQLEKQLTKDQILEAYMNTIPLGGSAYGVEAGAKQYFNKSAKDLTLIESAFLAGVIQSPSTFYYAAMSQKNTTSYINRTKTVLSKMQENEFISSSDYSKAISDINNNKLIFKKSSNNTDKLNYEWFSREVLKQVKNDLVSQYHISQTEAERMIMYGGLKIYSTMDKNLQDSTQNTLNNMDKILGINSNSDSNKILQPQASATIMDYHTGDVKALIGGRGTQPPMSFNRATEFYRAAGSSIKPLTVYGPAIDTKIATAASPFDDAPVPAEIGNLYPTNNGPYNPRNSPNVFEGTMPLREGLMKSKNVISVRIEHELGLQTGAEYAKKFGLKLDKSTDETSMSALALGQLSGKQGVSGTNTLDMAAAYGVFGNNGMRSEPNFYKKVVDRSGKTILEKNYSSTKVLSPQAAYIMYDLLKGPVSGKSGSTGYAANFSPMVRGKTGTTNMSIDLWFCGLTPYYSAAVWIGKDDHSSFNENYTFGKYIGSSDAALIWGTIMKEAHKNLEYKDINKPSGIVEYPICLDSGGMATDSCPKDRIITELFIEGTAPSSICNYHTYYSAPRKEKKPEKSKPDNKKNDKNNKDKLNPLLPPKDSNNIDNNDDKIDQ
ncbi:transglycosylase domain-containing protein [Clostridium rectalis]|uniref:transglycosylase domain-containing protein n=1 Tax=Clostridium rectalis TaxID=2040295 RepID=UPI001FA9F85D|nr:PBP1A family penicillin-binding protein [Clostridium rectalis]